MARPVALAVSSSSTFEYVLEENREDKPEDQAVFLLRPPTVAEDEKYLNNAGTLAKIGTKAHEMLRAHLRGWRNFLAEDGTEVEFEARKSGEPADSSLEAIPIRYRVELMNAITSRGRVADSEEVKGK